MKSTAGRTARVLAVIVIVMCVVVALASGRTRIGAICKDGTRSYATGRGACSHHGGVARWLYAEAETPAKVTPTPSTPATTVPAPSILITTVTSSSQIDLSWHDNSWTEAGFKIERKLQGGSYSQVATVGANVTTYSDTGLSPATTYCYRVCAYNALGGSSYSNERWAATADVLLREHFIDAGQGDAILVAYEESFSDPAATTWTLGKAENTNRWIESGRYNILVNRPNWFVPALCHGEGWANFQLDVDASQVAGPDSNAFGVLFRYLNPDNYYRFYITSTGYVHLGKRFKGEWSSIVDWQKSTAVHPGTATNHITVVADGPSLTCYVNENQVLQATDYSLVSGDIGVAASAFATVGVHVAFDNVAVRVPIAPTP